MVTEGRKQEREINYRRNGVAGRKIGSKNIMIREKFAPSIWVLRSPTGYQFGFLRNPGNATPSPIKKTLPLSCLSLSSNHLIYLIPHPETFSNTSPSARCRRHRTPSVLNAEQPALGG